MSKTEFVTYMIQHTDNFPDTEPISLESAKLLISNTFETIRPADLTAEEAMEIWNRLIKDPAVMDPDIA